MFMDIFERIDFKCYRENFNVNQNDKISYTQYSHKLLIEILLHYYYPKNNE